MLKTFYLAKNILTSNFKDLDIPYRFTYILTYKCQLRCNMCNIWQRQDEYELTTDEIKKFFERSNKFSWVNLSGGEIFLRKDLPEIIEAIVKNCRFLFVLDFPTNGMNTDTIVGTTKKILGFKIPRLFITISLDGPPQIHDTIRGVKGAWERAVNTFSELKKLRNSNFSVFFGMTLQGSNIDSFADMFAAVKKLIPEISYNDFHINIAHASRHYYGGDGNQYNIEPKTLWGPISEIIKLRKSSFLNPVSFLERRYQSLSKLFLETGITPMPCQALSASFFMDPCGNVYPCSIFDRPIGNVRDFDYSIQKIWNSQKKLDTRKLIRKKQCPNCWTPCEAYQSILANLVPRPGKKG